MTAGGGTCEPIRGEMGFCFAMLCVYKKKVWILMFGGMYIKLDKDGPTSKA